MASESEHQLEAISDKKTIERITKELRLCRRAFVDLDQRTFAVKQENAILKRDAEGMHERIEQQGHLIGELSAALKKPAAMIREVETFLHRMADIDEPDQTKLAS